MQGIDDSSYLIGRIYDAALDERLWPDVIDRLRRMVDCRAGALMYGSLQPVVISMTATVGMDQALARRVPEIFGDPTDNPFIIKFPVLAMGQPVPRQAFIDDEAFERHRIYHEFFEPQDLFHDITTPVTLAPDVAVALYLGRERRAGPLGETEAAILLPWVPHIQRALLIDRQLRQHRSGSMAVAEMLDRLSCGIAFVGPSGTILSMNRAAEEITGAGDGLKLRGQRLLATSGRDNRELGKAIDQAMTGGGGGSLLVARPSASRSYLVFTAPLSQALAAQWPGGPAAVVIFSDPENAQPPPTGILMQLYGLTTAESNMAVEIVKGFGLDAAAAKLGISRNTAKTHLDRIFDKTGTRRQAELVRLLLISTPDIAPDANPPNGGGDLRFPAATTS